MGKIKAAALSVALVTALSFFTCFDAGAFSADDSHIRKRESPSAGGKNGVSFSQPGFGTIIGNSVAEGGQIGPSVTYPPAAKNYISSGEGATEIPSSYSIVENGSALAVENQNPYGACWTFAANESAETSIMDAVPAVDLSEMHTAFYTYYGETGNPAISTDVTAKELLDAGGTSFAVANLWAQWKGPVSGDAFSYPDERLMTDSDFAASHEYSADYHLRNAYFYDFDGNYGDRENVNDLTKRFLMENKAVDVSFCTDGYSSDTNAAYSVKDSRYANHTVSIVGWDDDYTADNFDGKKGAWLAKNSWGTHWGDNGYFRISYDDSSLCEFSVFELDGKDNYATNHQLDNFVPSLTMCADDKEENQPSYMANIFHADNSEQIEAVSMYAEAPGTEYEITVYTDLADLSDPVSGKASSVTKGISDLAGYITVELGENVPVAADSDFSVVVRLYSDNEKYILPVETCMILEDKESGEIDDSLSSFVSYDQICALTGENQSFYSEDGTSWTDVTAEDYTYSEEDKQAFFDLILSEYEDMLDDEKIKTLNDYAANYDLKVVMGNFSLKAFGNPADTVDFSRISGSVPSDEKIELSVKSGKDIMYSVNGGEYIPYDSPIAITEKVTVSATTDGKTFASRTYEPAVAQFNALMYSADSGTGFGRDADFATKKDDVTYEIILSGTEKKIRFLPVSSAEVTFNGEKVNINSFTDEVIIGEGVNTFEFELSQENRSDSVITVNVVNHAVSFDIEKETVSPGNVRDLTAPDGHIFRDGESVSDYAGETLTGKLSGKDIQVKVPERAVFPDMEIDFYNETLNFISNDIAGNVVYSVKENPTESEYISAEKRLIDGQNITSGMVMNSAFRIIPGETVTLKIKAAEGMFASKERTYEIPSAPVSAPTGKPVYTVSDGKYELEYSDTVEYGMLGGAFSEESLNALASDFGYKTEEFVKIMMKRYGTNDREELLEFLDAEWEFAGTIPSESKKPVTVAMRYYSTDGEFASAAVLAQLKYLVKGDIDLNDAIDSSDASYVLSYYAKASTGSAPALTDDESYIYDYNSDSYIDSSDASGILSYYAAVATQSAR